MRWPVRLGLLSSIWAPEGDTAVTADEPVDASSAWCLPPSLAFGVLSAGLHVPSSLQPLGCSPGSPLGRPQTSMRLSAQSSGPPHACVTRWPP